MHFNVDVKHYKRKASGICSLSQPMGVNTAIIVVVMLIFPSRYLSAKGIIYHSMSIVIIVEVRLIYPYCCN